MLIDSKLEINYIKE